MFVKKTRISKSTYSSIWMVEWCDFLKVVLYLKMKYNFLNLKKMVNIIQILIRLNFNFNHLGDIVFFFFQIFYYFSI